MIKPNVKAQSILKRIEYATLATVDAQGQPWNTPVYYAYDKDSAIYWRSPIESQHSQNIRATGKVFIVIYNSTVMRGKGEGVYMQAECVELNDSNTIAKAYKLLQDRCSPLPYWRPEEVQGHAPARLYKATPQKIWMNAGAQKDGQYIDVRLETEDI